MWLKQKMSTLMVAAVPLLTFYVYYFHHGLQGNKMYTKLPDFSSAVTEKQGDINMEKLPLVTSYSRMYRPISFSLQPNLSACPRDIDLLVIVYSSPKHVSERKAIRSSWGKEGNCLDKLYIIFVMGKTSSWDKNIVQEQFKFRDILQGDFLDSDSGVLKFMTSITWLTSVTSKFLPKYVLKTTEKTYLNFPLIIKWLSQVYPAARMMYVGKLVRRSDLEQDHQDPRFVSQFANKKSLSLDFITGPQYLFSIDVIIKMSYALRRTAPITLEDAYIGLLAKANRIQPKHDDHFNLLVKTRNTCLNARLLFVHIVSPNELVQLHRQVKKAEKMQECQPVNRGRDVYGL